MESKNKPFFSIVCACYNCEHVLNNAIKSITNQGFQDWELILVDDCSTDSTNELCSEYSSNESRIHLFKTIENSGPFIARRVGISHSNGEYLLFLDSDDFYLENALQNIHDKIAGKNIDCLFYNVITASKNRSQLIDLSTYPKQIVTDKNENFRFLFDGFVLKQGLYRKCFKNTNASNSVINSNQRLKMFEDGLQTIILFKNCERVLYLETPFYQYNNQPDSLTKQKELYFDNIDALDCIIDELVSVETSKTIQAFCLNNIISCLCILIRRNYLFNSNKKIIRDNNERIRSMRNFNLLAEVELDKSILKKDKKLFTYFCKKQYLLVKMFCMLLKIKKRIKK